ncbi:MAG TPA: hypothetical protein VNO26_13955 [Candidatus Limnocylindria bacterium]|nr:hypothetical protein [Candidatus Limnocylindria bacterium]
MAGGRVAVLVVLVASGRPAAAFIDIAGPAYQDQTPICHYLERGIGDLEAGKRDVHALVPKGVETLADLDHVTFGLDLPYTRCQDTPRSQPCCDEDETPRWCIEKLEVWIGSKKFFEREEVDGDCTLRVGGGLDGTRTITRGQLRASPLWGFTAAELLEYLPYLEPGVNGGLRLKPPGIHFGAEYFARVLEGAVGDYLARENKGCANPTYCSNRRGYAGVDSTPLMAWTRAKKVDCDLGGCPDKSKRRSSPWLEIKGTTDDRLKADLDVELVNATYDPGDCVAESPFAQDCGSIHVPVARGSVEFELAFPCVEWAVADVPGQGLRRLPYCAGATPGSPCFQLAGPLLPTTTVGMIECDDPADAAYCGQSATLARTEYDQTIDLAEEPKFDAEGGVLVDLIEFFCHLLGPIAVAGGCNADDISTKKLTSQLDASLFRQTLFRALPGCPAVGVSSKGDVSFDFRELDACPPGAANPACAQPGGFTIPGSPDNSRDGVWKPKDFATAQQAWGIVGVPKRKLRRLAKTWRDTLPVFVDVKPSTKDKGVGTLTAEPPPKRLKPFEIDHLLETVCAVQRLCADGFNLAATLAGLSTAQLESLVEGGITNLDPAIGQALVADDAFMSACVEPHHPYLPDTPFTRLASLGAWVADVAAEAAKTGPGSCREEAPGIEDLYPVPGIVLAITTGGDNVPDQFAFVNFRKDNLPADIPAADRATFGCRHLKASYLPPADIPTCTGGKTESGADCGTVPGDACADLRDAPTSYLFETENHPNGDWSPFHRCSFDIDTNAPLVCKRQLFPGAGTNYGGICKFCGLPRGESPGLYTMQGCPVEDGGDCPEGYDAGADGKCWLVETGQPEWECQAGCREIYGSTGYCLHPGAWRDWLEDTNPTANAAITAAKIAGSYYAEGICAEWVCDADGIDCAAAGLACSNDACATECTDTADCDPFTGFPLRYPAGFECSVAHTCRLP